LGAGTGANTSAVTTVTTTAVFNSLQFQVVVTGGSGETAISNTAALTVQ
jgi:hypothetical protein